ncbi:MAG: DNA-protecting protein DprA [Clostridiales bacterium]|nr:DNA-protecting protein DprA [Clostridiales bacterium]
MNNILNDNDKAVIALVIQTNITYAKIKEIIETLPDVSLIFSIDKVSGLISKNLVSEINKIDVELLNNYICNVNSMGIDIVTYLSDMYPDNLREIHNPPLLLYTKGDLSLMSGSDNLAVVGTRRATSYGEEVTNVFCKTLAKEGLCIVSGLADGIDTFAHQSAVNVKGKTIAVLGSGINNIYPAVNVGLAEKIIATGGLVISEYPPNEGPQAYHFPARNRIIAGISKGVLIIEAPLRSGALITKEYALDCNRDIFVVPGRITDIYSKGSNEVIKSCQGAIVLSPEDILNSFGKTLNNRGKSVVMQFTLEEQLIIDVLNGKEVHFDAIITQSGLTSAKVNSILMKLELKNIVKKMPGNMYTMAMN